MAATTPNGLPMSHAARTEAADHVEASAAGNMDFHLCVTYQKSQHFEPGLPASAPDKMMKELCDYFPTASTSHETRISVVFLGTLK